MSGGHGSELINTLSAVKEEKFETLKVLDWTQHFTFPLSQPQIIEDSALFFEMLEDRHFPALESLRLRGLKLDTQVMVGINRLLTSQDEHHFRVAASLLAYASSLSVTITRGLYDSIVSRVCSDAIPPRVAADMIKLVTSVTVVGTSTRVALYDTLIQAILYNLKKNDKGLARACGPVLIEICSRSADYVKQLCNEAVVGVLKEQLVRSGMLLYEEIAQALLNVGEVVVATPGYCKPSLVGCIADSLFTLIVTPSGHYKTTVWLHIRRAIDVLIAMLDKWDVKGMAALIKTNWKGLRLLIQRDFIIQSLGVIEGLHKLLLAAASVDPDIMRWVIRDFVRGQKRVLPFRLLAEEVAIGAAYLPYSLTSTLLETQEERRVLIRYVAWVFMVSSPAFLQSWLESEI